MGSSFYDSLSKDLQDVFLGTKGFSARNLMYTKRFFCLFKSKEKFDATIGFEILPQVGAQIFDVPWDHIKKHNMLITKILDMLTLMGLS